MFVKKVSVVLIIFEKLLSSDHNIELMFPLVFAESKIVTSVYSKDFDGLLSKTIQKKVSFDQIPSEEIQLLKTANYENLIQLSLNHSDGYVVADDGALNKIEKLIESKDIPVMDFDQTKEDKAFVSYYSNKIF